MSTITIYHNPDCGTSRNTLGLIRNTGAEPAVIEYLKTPPSREAMADLIQSAGLTVRQALREKCTPFLELGPADPVLTDAQMLDVLPAHPIPLNRPFVATPLGVRFCRPSELALDIRLPTNQGPFAKEDGDIVIDQ